jgi:DNA-binding GntR family transcriptional regulator
MKTSRTLTEAVREDILRDVFPAGSRLVESVLCERYEVSRASVRAALLELASEGLVDREHNRGATVRRIDAGEAIQITEARAALEGLLASQSATHATSDEREELVGLVRQMRMAVESDDAISYGKLNAALHRLIRESARHPVAASLVDNLRNRAVHQQFRLSMVPGRPGESLAQHEAIVNAIVAGDGDAASFAMHAHLKSVADVLRHWGERSPY